MTDNEIIKALECCVNDNCEECSYGEDECFANLNELTMFVAALIACIMGEIH